MNINIVLLGIILVAFIAVLAGYRLELFDNFSQYPCQENYQLIKIATDLYKTLSEKDIRKVITNVNHPEFRPVLKIYTIGEIVVNSCQLDQDFVADRNIMKVQADFVNNFYNYFKTGINWDVTNIIRNYIEKLPNNDPLFDDLKGFKAFQNYLK